MRILWFCVVALVAIVATDRLVGAGLRNIETSSFGVFNRIVDGQINATVLITGSSRALNHYDPREITRVTGASASNIGINGSQDGYAIWRFSRHISATTPRQRC